MRILVIRDYEKAIANADKADDNKLIALYKILSPVHLLKEKIADDSNSLDKSFCEELHIIGCYRSLGRIKAIPAILPSKREAAPKAAATQMPYQDYASETSATCLLHAVMLSKSAAAFLRLSVFCTVNPLRAHYIYRQPAQGTQLLSGGGKMGEFIVYQPY